MKQYYRIIVVTLTLLWSVSGTWAQHVEGEPTHLKIFQKSGETLIPIEQIDSIRFESVTTPYSRPMMGIEYAAEYNVGKEAGSFATSHSNDASGYFPSDQIGSVCPTGYHTPTRYEAAVLMPSFGPKFEVYLLFNDTKAFSNVPEAIQVGSTKASYLNDYKAIKDKNISYALRFKKGAEEMHPDFPAASDNSQQAAYRYEVVGEHKMNSLDAHLKITVRYLGEHFTGTIDDIATEEYWAENSQDDIVRIIPASIYYHPQSKKEVMGMGAYYWTSSPYEPQDGWMWTISYIPKMAYISYNSALFKFGIRPFKDAQ